NEFLFQNLGFYAVAKTDDVLLMENKKNGIASFVASLGINSGGVNSVGAESVPPESAPPEASGLPAGAVVMNCNPFTRGHQYLIENAARQCARLRVFVVSENKSAFPADARYRLVREGTAHIKNVLVHPTGPYLISSATFPDYFLKDSLNAASSIQSINTLLDLTIFAEGFAKPLGINRRFVGTEPFDPVTAGYNRQMKEVLPRFGIEVIEIDRLEEEGEAVSASRVRRLLKEGKLEEIRALVPETTYDYLVKNGTPREAEN
ncbi:MAG: adenylyltransferase/cytidyltransferase family protein, partial [Treponema sp.]|nr:adenylyltransferase/cytidyltransferase family protein [Treponema sp.]